MRTGWRLAMAALAGASTVILTAPAPARAIDDPPNVMGSNAIEAAAALAKWCVYTRAELMPAHTGELAVDGSALIVDKQDFLNAETADCEDGDSAPIVQLYLYTLVPDLTGLTLAEAGDLLAQRALPIEVRAGPAEPDSIVRGQEPAEGTQIGIDAWPLASRPVLVDLEAPPTGRTEEVPDLRTWREDAACAALTDRRLACAVRAVGTGVPPGTVTRQTPAPGTVVAIGTQVLLFVDRTAARVRVPDLRGQTVAQAEAALARLGLGLAVVSIEDGTPDRVASQDPPAGTDVDPGTTVEVRIPRAPDRFSLGPAAYATGGGILALLLIGGLVLMLRPSRRAHRRPRLVTSARARLEPGGWSIEELPGRPNLTVDVRVRAGAATTTLEETGEGP